MSQNFTIAHFSCGHYIVPLRLTKQFTSPAQEVKLKLSSGHNKLLVKKISCVSSSVKVELTVAEAIEGVLAMNIHCLPTQLECLSVQPLAKQLSSATRLWQLLDYALSSPILFTHICEVGDRLTDSLQVINHLKRLELFKASFVFQEKILGVDAYFGLRINSAKLEILQKFSSGINLMADWEEYKINMRILQKILLDHDL